MQLCLPFIAESAADIIETLFEDYAGISPALIDTAAWATEMSAFLPTLYTAMITEPTGVNKLVTELIQQAGLAVWWDALAPTMRLQVLRAIPTTAAVFDEANILAKSIRTADQPNKRISEVLAYYGVRNPLRPVDEEDNYRAALLTINPGAAADYNGIVTRTVKSRWIPFGAQQTTERMSNILLSRFQDPPRKIDFDTWRFGDVIPELGGGYRVGWTDNQDLAGNAVLAPIQVTRLGTAPDRYQVEAEEMLWANIDQGSLQDRVIIIPSNLNNVNLRTLHDSIYPAITDDDVSHRRPSPSPASSTPASSSAAPAPRRRPSTWATGRSASRRC